MMNSCSFIGRLTADPKRFDGETSRVCFTLAVDSDNYKGSKETADYLDFVAWNKTAEYIDRHFNKGDLMCVANSRARVRQYENSDGIKVRKIEFEVGKAYCVGRSRTVNEE